MPRVLLLLLFCCNITTTRSQTPVVDSFKALLAEASSDGQRLDVSLAICANDFSIPPDTLRYYAALAQQTAMRIDAPDATQMAHYYTAAALTGKRQMKEALDTISKYAKPGGNGRATAMLELLRGKIFISTGNFTQAIATFYKILGMDEGRKNSNIRIRTLNSLGWTYLEMGEYAKALPWLHQAAALGDSDPDLAPYLPYVYSNLASTLTNVDSIPKALDYVHMAIKRADQQHNLVTGANARAVLADILIKKHAFGDAERLLAEAIAIRRRIGDPYYIVADMVQLAFLYATAGQGARGIAISKEALSIAASYKLSARIPQVYAVLAESYAAAGDDHNRAITLDTLLRIKEDAYQQNSAEALAGLQASYELQQRENTIIRQQLSIVQKNNLLYLGLLLVVVLGGSFFMLFSNYRRRQKTRLQQLHEEEQRLAAAAVAAAEEKERARIAADLHDNLGSYAAAIAANLEHLSTLNGSSIKSIALEELHSNGHAMIAELSDTIWVLKKDALHLTAVCDRLKTFIARVSRSYPRFSFDVDEQFATDYLIPSAQAFQLFKILQEAITNALRHSGGDTIRIYVSSGAGWEISVINNGCCEDIKFIESRAGHGISGMYERSAEAGWKLSITAVPGGGTQVSIAAEPHIQYQRA